MVFAIIRHHIKSSPIPSPRKQDVVEKKWLCSMGNNTNTDRAYARMVAVPPEPPPARNLQIFLQDLVERVPADTRVYYCGEAKFDRPLRAVCARMCLRYSYTGVCA